MTPRVRYYFGEYCFVVAAWTVALYLLWFVAFWGPAGYLREGALRDYLEGPIIHLEILSEGVLWGSFFALINQLSDRPGLRSRPFGEIIAVKSLAYLVALALVAGLVWLLFQILGVMPSMPARELEVLLSARFLAALLVFLVVTTLAVNFLTEVRRKFGPGALSALLTGRYHRPRDEQLIVLFMDLEGSTTLAEALGHARYSLLIRECFHDLTEFVLRCNARIYQYLGDGVILTWPDQGGQHRHCIDLVQGFQAHLQRRAAHYRQRFDSVPRFRAGADCGVVTVSEVGDLRRDLAYHGDVLNTAARLQDLGKQHQAYFMISERLAAHLKADPAVSLRPAGSCQLRGKLEHLAVFIVEPSDS